LVRNVKEIALDGGAGSAPAVVRRPRDRKARIAGTAAHLFAERGYHRVGVDDVASAEGITGGAIYRHFGTKGDLLARTVADALDELETVVASIDESATVGELVGALAAFSVSAPHVAPLIEREARHLAPGNLDEHHRRSDVLMARAQAAVSATRPELEPDDCAFLVRSALAALSSPSYHHVSLPASHAEAVVGAMATAVLASRALPRPAGHPAAPRSAPIPRASRREALLAAATTLFARRGYQAVTMEEIGAAAGIAGTSVYQYYEGKGDLLVAAFNRGAEWLQFGLSQALAGADDEVSGLALVVRSYVDFVLGHLDLMSLLLTESVHLPDDQSEVVRRSQHDYVAEWLAVLARVRPELSEPEARFRIHGALAIVNDTARPGRPPVTPPLDQALAELALEALAA
jgi:AcrR family transcriptional regulator